MTIFEPVLLLVVLAAAIVTGAIAVAAIRGRTRRAAQLAIRLGVGMALYLLTLVGASLLVTPEIHDPGSPLCFDDWCVDVVTAGRPVEGGDYEVVLRLSSRARRQPMGERGTYVYLEGARGARYEPRPEDGEAPFSAVLQPGQAIETTRRFVLPSEEVPRALVYARRGFPIQWLVIAEGGWFQPPPAFRLPPS